VWGEQTARQMLGEAGFSRIDSQRVEGDFLNVYYVARRERVVSAIAGRA